MESVDEHVALCSLEETAPVIENDLHGRDDDGDGNKAAEKYYDISEVHLDRTDDGEDSGVGDDNKVADEYCDISEVDLDRTDALLDAADPLHSRYRPTIASQHRNQTLGLKYK